jgi:hypothetical protein
MIPQEAAELLKNLELDTKMNDYERADVLAKICDLINQTRDKEQLQEIK